MYASGPGQNQTMCAIGRYENVNQSTANTSTAENLMRSAKAPRIRHTVIAANVAWNATYTSSGIGVFLENVAAIANSPFGGVERALEEQPIEAAEVRVALGEREAVAVDAPQHA